MYILLAALLAVNVLLYAGIFLAYRHVKRKLSEYQASAYEFLMPIPDDEAGMSPAGRIIDTVTTNIGRSVAAHMKSALMADSSAAARGDKVIEADMAEDIARSNPVVSGLLNQFPSLRKTLRRNPALTEIALQKLAEKFLTGGSGSNGHQSSTVSMNSKFSL